MAALARLSAPETCDRKPVVKVIFEACYNQGDITKMSIIKKVNDVGCKYPPGHASLAELHDFFRSIPHYFSYRSHNHVAVHMKMPNGMPQPVRQFLIVENN